MDKIKVTVLGGGTGSLAVLKGLKNFTDVEIKVIVNMTDDGGSNIIVRDEFGLLPLSDIRKSIIALSDENRNDMLRKMFTYRFYKGESFIGHTLGNIIMMALSDIAGSEVDAIKAACDLFGIKQEIIPVTINKSTLCAEYSDGKTLLGEHLIDETKKQQKTKIEKLSLKPTPHAYDKALMAIKESDYVILGPGDLYTTTIANLIVRGMSEALNKTKAKILFISNLMTKSGQTHWMKASDHVEEIKKYIGKYPDIVLINKGTVPLNILRRYNKQGERKVEDDIKFGNGYRVIKADIVEETEVVKQKGDSLIRSYIRHDPYKLGYILYGIMHDYHFTEVNA